MVRIHGLFLRVDDTNKRQIGNVSLLLHTPTATLKSPPNGAPSSPHGVCLARTLIKCRTNKIPKGSGNTFTNELYFIGTRPNKSGQPICGNLPQNPYGKYKIQAASSGKYVTASSGSSKLVASGNDANGAAAFNSQYVPNAGTLQLDSTKQYVTADQGGKYALDAARGSASSWEKFTIRQKVGAENGVYSIKASSNGLFVTIGGDGSLINNGAKESDSAGFRFVQA